RLVHTQVAEPVLLPVQVGKVHPVKINEMQVSHSDPCQKKGDVGTQAPQARHRRPGGGKLFLHRFRVAETEGFPDLFLCDLFFHAQPPPTKLTTSSTSPSRRMVSSYLLLGTISPFNSTAILCR